MTEDAPEPDWRRLNEEFYSGDPAGYFSLRLNMLLLAAGAPDEVHALLAAGVRYEGLISSPLDRSTQARNDLDVAYLLTESQTVLHHVSEALMRLFLGHADGGPCPWIEVAALRNFARFKKQMAVLASPTWSSDLEDAVPFVFLGGEPIDRESSAAAQRAVTRLIRHLAGRLLEDSNLYNSVKHGMAVVGSRHAYVSISETGAAAPFIGSNGPSVAFMESEVRGDRRVWSVTRRWTSIRQALWLSQLALSQIDALWAVGRARYLGAALPGVQVVTEEAVADGITGTFADAGGITRYSTKVAEEILSARGGG